MLKLHERQMWGEVANIRRPVQTRHLTLVTTGRNKKIAIVIVDDVDTIHFHDRISSIVVGGNTRRTFKKRLWSRYRHKTSSITETLCNHIRMWYYKALRPLDACTKLFVDDTTTYTCRHGADAANAAIDEKSSVDFIIWFSQLTLMMTEYLLRSTT